MAYLSNDNGAKKLEILNGDESGIMIRIEFLLDSVRMDLSFLHYNSIFPVFIALICRLGWHYMNKIK